MKSIVSLKPFLRWAGSKRQLIPAISQYWNNNFTRYIEPFAGSASLFFNLAPTSAILGDINADLVTTYEQVKTNLPALILELHLLQKGEKYYNLLRKTNPSTLDPAKRAARFIYLNRFCFNGLYRTNLAGEFNVPYGGDRTGKIPSDDLLIKCSNCLQNARLLNCSFEKILELVIPGDFVYMDPPFSVVAHRVFREYDALLFSREQIDNLRNWMIKLNNKGITFLVSYAESEEGNFLGKDFYVKTVRVRRNIAGFAANRRHATELLISNLDMITTGDNQ
jgi:DNA adenine methylase